jgi:uncharacterized protein YdeI (YjbR/CyaY-like superfamily)
MGKKDPRVDAYIAKSADFAKPILAHLRALVHTGCPAVAETIKWGVPSFEYQGMLCGMAAFKAHCGLNFWNRALEIPGADASAGQFGRIASLSDLPKDRVILGYIREAARLNETGQKLGPAVRREREPLPVPAALKAALKTKPRALAQFEKFSPSQRREYSEWIVDAKTDATRDKRLATAVAWIGEGKPRMWKYRKPKPATAAPARRP